MIMKSEIFQMLETLGLTSMETKVLYNRKTRDVDDLCVYKDLNSGVIFIDDFYTGDQTYADGKYRQEKTRNLKIDKPDLERSMDANRRFKSNLRFVAGKNVADFGCGSGEFLKLVKPFCNRVVGVDLQRSYREELIQFGIDFADDLESIEDASLDVIVSFHAIEHLPDPLRTLSLFKQKIVNGGSILVEVPHANDFLLNSCFLNEFKQFTLWSQHLVLHTRESLRKMLEFSGYTDVKIQGVQRYPLSNHLHWLSRGTAGGHKSQLSLLDSDELFGAYENALARIDETDTLVALATVP